MSGSGGYCGGDGGGPTKVLGLITDDSVVVPPNPSTGDITIRGGTNVTTSGNAGTYTVTINAAGEGSFIWVLADTTPITMTPETGYSVQCASEVVFSLPATCEFGQTMRVCGFSASGWTINIGSGQSVNYGSLTALTSLTFTQESDCVELLCIIQDTVYEIVSSIGNITVV